MAKSNPKWEKQAEAAKATQVAFDVSESVHQFIQAQSVVHQLKPSDFIRKLLGLNFKQKKVRPRLTVTLNEDDYKQLGSFFNIDSSDRIAIKHAVAKRLMELSER